MRGRSGARSASGALRWLAFAGVLLLGVVGTAAILAGSGYWTKPAPSRVGLVPVPRSIRALKAYHKITREDVYDLQRGDDSYFWLPQARVAANPDWKLTVDQVVGRVMARDKGAEFVFSEKDFLPEGSRPGLVGGVPPGKRAMIVSGDQLQGLQFLNRGDHFDLFATVGSRGEGAAAPVLSQFHERDGLTGGLRAPEATALDLQKRLGIRLLVRNGVIVENSTRSAAQRSRPGTGPTHDLTIAVEPGEVVSLTHALGAKQSIFCAARSGQPEEATGSAEAFQPDLKGLVPYVVRTARIPAYAELTAAQLIDPDLGQPAVLYFQPGEADPGWIADPRQLIGRVAARDLQPGYVFQESDFLPVGSTPGVAGAVPPGFVGVTLTAGQISGLEQLQTGDRFAILLSIGDAVAAPQPQVSWASLEGGRPDPTAVVRDVELRSGIRRLADQVLKVSSIDQTIVVAVRESELIGLSQALTSKRPVQAVLRSRQHADDESQSPDENAALRPVPVVVKPIAPFEQITLEHFLDPATGEPHRLFFPRERIREDWQTELSALLGRVSSQAIAPGYVVRQGDLLPVGTRPGLTAAIPPGQVGLVVTGEQVQGLAELGSGDRLMLVASGQIDWQSAGLNQRTGLVSGSPRELLNAESAAGMVNVAVVADEITVLSQELQTVYVERVTHIVTETNQSRETRLVPEQVEKKLNIAMLAIPAAALADVRSALTAQAPLTAVVRSARGDEPAIAPQIGQRRPAQGAVVIEHIRGLTRQRRDVWPRPQ